MSNPTVLMLSMRRVARLVAFSLLYEFEDIVAALTGSDRVDATEQPFLQLSRRAYKYARFCTGSPLLARKLAPGPPPIRISRDYDLFLPMFNHPYELYALAALPNWRKRCRFAACFIVEAWGHQLPGYLLELLAEFDHVFVASYNVVSDIARIAGKPCSYLPIGADVLMLAPYPQLPPRTIDVCNVGRRSPATHQALLDLASADPGFFYFYDTVAARGTDLKQRTFSVQNPSEHRRLLASILQRSRYYIANRARANEPNFLAGGDEISVRFYEGAAAGTVMLGEPPQLEEFKRQFDWPDAIVSMPFDAPLIADLLADLNKDPTRLNRIQRDNVYYAALRHDWLYRLRVMFDKSGLPFTPAMQLREQRLQSLAAMTRLPQNRPHGERILHVVDSACTGRQPAGDAGR
jgi:hypothetical protein